MEKNRFFFTMGLHGASQKILNNRFFSFFTMGLYGGDFFLVGILELQAHHVKAGIEAVTVMCLKFHNSQNLEIRLFQNSSTRLGWGGL